MSAFDFACIAARCRAIVINARKALGNDLRGGSMLDLCADNISGETLKTLDAALCVAFPKEYTPKFS